MANKKRRCTSCKKYKEAVKGIVAPIGFFCDKQCQYNYATKSSKQLKEKTKVIVYKKQKAKDTQRKKELMTRSQWYQKLQQVKNKWVTKVRDVDEFCCTCPKQSDVKYDAGHYIAVGKNIDLRFEETNIHKQCSLQCNQFGRGMPVEYDEFIKQKYGVGHYNWLNTKFLCYKPHPTLKELFPTWQDIEEEIHRYRKLLKDAGI